MPPQYCFLCASDEGVFLDITTENEQTFCTQFKICSLVKAPTTDQLPTKICHKCAYEVNQCSTFLEKYKKAAKQRNHNRKKCCSLCFEQANKEYIFTLKKQNTLQLKSINKIQQILKDEIDKVEGNNILVCLPCRYTVDVLFDLKNLSNEISSKLDNKVEEDIDYSRLPKVKTTVISRKTTITESARATLNPKQSTESDSDAMTRTRSKAKVNNNRVNNSVGGKSGEQVCEECHDLTADKDLHKNEKTGQTLCKVCWENSRLNVKDVEAQNPAETKVCKVFLKDVLSQPAAPKGKQANEIEKDNQSRRKRKTTTAKQSKPPSGEPESNTGKQVEKRSIRSENSDDSDNKDIPNKKAKRSTKEAVMEREPSPQAEPVLPRLTRNRKVIANAKQSPDSDSALASNNVKEPKVPPAIRKRAISSSLSDVDVEMKRDRTRLKGILTGNSSLKGSDINDGSTTDDGVSKKKKLRFRSDSPIYIDLTTASERNGRSRRNVTKRSSVDAEKVAKPSSEKVAKPSSEKVAKPSSEKVAKPSSEKVAKPSSEKVAKPSSEKVAKPSSEKVAKPSSEKVAKPSSVKKTSEPETNVVSALDEEIKTYSCEECGVTYENKLVFLMHKLTHYKQPRLELEKVTVETKSKKESRDTREAADEQFEDQSETIRITVEDDEEDVEVEAISVNSSTDANLSTSSHAEEVADPAQKDTRKDTLDTEVPPTELDKEESTEKDDKAGKSLQARRSRSLSDSTDKANADVPELAEEENVEDISLTNIEDDQEEKEGEEQKEIGPETPKKEKPQREKDVSVEDAITAAVEEDKNEAETRNEKQPKEIASEEKLGEVVDDDELDSSQNLEADRTQEESKLNSSDVAEEENRIASPEKPEENQVEERERRDSSDVHGENPKDEQSELSDKSQANPVEDKLDSPDKSPEVSVNEKDKTDSPGRPEERRVTRKSRSLYLAKLEENDKQDSPEKSRGKSRSPEKSEERRSPRRSKSTSIARSKENTEDKQESSERPEEEDKLGSPVEAEEKKLTRNSKPGLLGKSEEKDQQQDSSEKSRDDPDSVENLDANESKEKTADKDDGIIEINDDSSDSVREVCENECNNEIGIDDVTEVQTVEVDDEDNNLPADVEEVSERKDDGEEVVECTEINCSDKSSNGNNVQTNDEDIAEVQPISDPADVAAEILQEVLDLASAEIQKRQDGVEIDGVRDSNDMETLDNISLEVQNGGDTRP